MKVIIITLAATSLVVFGLLLQGYTAHCLYEWFILSTIKGLPVFTILQWIWFSFFLSSINPNEPNPIKDEFKKDVTNLFASTLVRPLVLLVLGYVLHLFY